MRRNPFLFDILTSSLATWMVSKMRQRPSFCLESVDRFVEQNFCTRNPNQSILQIRCFDISVLSLRNNSRAPVVGGRKLKFGTYCSEACIEILPPNFCSLLCSSFAIQMIAFRHFVAIHFVAVKSNSRCHQLRITHLCLKLAVAKRLVA